MTIQIDGVGTVNKGAELLLFAILQEVEKHYPDAKVIYNDGTFMESNQQSEYFHSELRIVKPYYMTPFFTFLLKRFHIIGIIERLNPHWNVKYLLDYFLHYKVDVIFNASGYSISDNFIGSEVKVNRMEKFFLNKKRGKTIIVYLPQAFGPCEKNATKACVKILSKHADLVFARETISYNYLRKENFDLTKLYQYPDFTCLVDGIFPQQYATLINSVCLIPNMKMVDKHIIDYKEYLNFWGIAVKTIQHEGRNVFVLNHEGFGDEIICKEISQKYSIPLVSGLNALETKGVISNAYLVISSRFHGVASSLNSAVPCLATSWSHKYELLFKDYHQKGCILNVLNIDDCKNKIICMLQKGINQTTRNVLSVEAKKKKKQSREMWNIIWNKIDNYERH